MLRDPGAVTALEFLVTRLDAVHTALGAGHRRAVLFLVTACLLLFLPGFFTLQPMDRDEPRFAQATKQMLETGDFVRIRFQEEARNKKPVGIYWAQAVVVKAGEAIGVPDARRKIWLNRLVSLFGAIAAVLLTYWAALAFVARREALLAALLLGSTILLGVEARLAKTDAMLLATIVAAMGAFARIYLMTDPADRWRLPAIFWTAVGIGLLLKGPITPMVPLLAGVALAVVDRGAPWLRRLRPGPGVLWALLIALPWFVLIMIETRGAFLTDSLGKDMLAKVGSGKESHGAPPLTYFVAFWVTAWPMAPLAAMVAPWVWASRKAGPVLFLLAWIVPVWIVFELVPTKLPHYVLPTYPAIAIAIALGLGELARTEASPWRRRVLWLIPGVAALVVLAGAGLAIFTRAWPGLWWALLGLVAVLLAVLAARRDTHFHLRPLLGAGAAAALYGATYAGIMTGPPGSIVALSPQMAAAAQALRPVSCAEVHLASSGYREPSLVFLTDTSIAMGRGEETGRFMASGGCRIAFVELRQEPDFKKQIQGVDGVKLMRRIKGRNLNGGRALDIGVWVRQ